MARSDRAKREFRNVNANRHCLHCGRSIVNENGSWIDPEATGDDSVWREMCDANDTFNAEHEPMNRITKMIDSGLVERYKKFRAEHPGLPASYALRWAKGSDKSDRPDGFNVRGDSFTVDGFDIEITFDYDDANDYSHLGDFTNSWEEGAIENPEWHNDRRGTLRYFVPAITEREHFDGLHKMGMAKSVARELARSYVLWDMESARDYTSFVITVDASKEGIELGHDVLGGIDDEDYVEEAVIAHDMIGNAIAEAKSALAKLQEA